MHGDDDQGSNRDGSYCNYAQDGVVPDVGSSPLIPDRGTRGERCAAFVPGEDKCPGFIRITRNYAEKLRRRRTVL